MLIQSRCNAAPGILLVEEWNEDGQPRGGGGEKSTCGTPQGGVISPLLANLYMNRFFQTYNAIRVADPITIGLVIGGVTLISSAIAAILRPWRKSDGVNLGKPTYDRLGIAIVFRRWRPRSR